MSPIRLIRQPPCPYPLVDATSCCQSIPHRSDVLRAVRKAPGSEAIPRSSRRLLPSPEVLLNLCLGLGGANPLKRRVTLAQIVPSRCSKISEREILKAQTEDLVNIRVIPAIDKMSCRADRESDTSNSTSIKMHLLHAFRMSYQKHDGSKLEREGAKASILCSINNLE
jgi:hypothetical protein